ncbi:MAG: phosphoribosylamine--glycine ligase [Candidatus Cloacimonetes bacterium]|nr:phosphoribosylamine--glycine ligase [Candidatus Cloacimonadota bacterium]
MNILVIGGGGREHAIAHAFSRSPRVHTVFVSPGNPGMTDVATLVSLDDAAIAAFARGNDVGFVFIGPEQPLANGLADTLRADGVRVIGPSQAAARIESSKAFAKDIMRRYDVPTAAYEVFGDYEPACAFLRTAAFPLVIKADGLAAGKGVTVAHSFEEADEALRGIFIDQRFGQTDVVIEEFLVGWETSIFAFTDGEQFVSTIFSQDHKPLLNGDKGPNTGGMGAYAPVKSAERWRDEVNEKVFGRALAGLRAEGCPFSGILYAGLMMTADGPRVVEFNCRFGDPETEVVLPLLLTDMVSICEAIDGGEVQNLQLKWNDRFAVAVVAASGGYPGSYRKGLAINIEPWQSDEARVYYAGVKQAEDGLATSGGRVLLVAAVADTLSAACDEAYRHMNKISFDDIIYRTDIGAKGY